MEVNLALWLLDGLILYDLITDKINLTILYVYPLYTTKIKRRNIFNL
jgi:hypothetical protein